MAIDVRRAAHTKGLATCALAPVDTDEEYELGFARIDRDGPGCGGSRVVCIGAFDFSSGSVARVGVSLRSWNEPRLAEVFQRERPPADASHAIPAYRYQRHPHDVEATSAGLVVLADADDEVSDTFKALVAERLRAFAVPVVGWPGPTVASRAWSANEEAAALEPALASLVNPSLHGEQTRVAVEVRFGAARRESWGDALVFHVAVVARMSSAGSCPVDVREVRATGELVLRASNGEFIALHVRGPWNDEETACAGRRGDAGTRGEARTCNVGEWRVDVSWASCPSPV
jgi:hypothetical protein